MATITNFLQSNVQGILYYLTVLLGCVVAQVFALWKDYTGARGFIRQAMPSWSDHAVIRADFYLVSIIGSIVGTILFAPNDYRQALFAGIGWFAAVHGLSRAGNPTPTPPGNGAPDGADREEKQEPR